MLPLAVKYQTRSGKCYAYDVRTWKILRVSDLVYAILDDYYLLTPDKICEKHLALGKDTIWEALAELDQAQEQGLLCDHAPEISARIKSLCYQENPEPIRHFLAHRRRLLTLEVTHQCNLACDYCIYGKHYGRTRRPSDTPMSLDMAKRAVTHFVSLKPKMASIGFYGGEPLLEFKRIQEIVEFAEQLGAENGVDVDFHLTTNGTLLSEEKIHYLAAHEFGVMISVDGNREAHDRYRVFKTPGPNGERRGSFDVVIRNMERFAQLYPEYPARGIALTLTATANLREVERFAKRWKPLFPAFVSNVVFPVQSHLGAIGDEHWIEVGECHAVACRDESCVRRHSQKEGIGEIPEFDDWSTALATAMYEGIEKLKSKVCQCETVNALHRVREDFPVVEDLLIENLRQIHRRPVVGSAARKLPVTRLSCFPGAMRNYCSLYGDIFPCERVGFTELFKIGDVTSDVDADKAFTFLIEMVRLGCDCGNCVINQVCTLCPAVVSESHESPGFPDFLALQRACRRLASKQAFVSRLIDYTEIMEGNPKVLDWFLPKYEDGEKKDWVMDVKVVAAEQEDVELSVEELEEWV